LDTAEKIRDFKKQFETKLSIAGSRPHKRQKLQQDEEFEFKYETSEFVERLREENKVAQIAILKNAKDRPKICLDAIKALDKGMQHLFDKI
jgi:hypothetical protein